MTEKRPPFSATPGFSQVSGVAQVNRAVLTALKSQTVETVWVGRLHETPA
jgi:hypothetical protein